MCICISAGIVARSGAVEFVVRRNEPVDFEMGEQTIYVMYICIVYINTRLASIHLHIRFIIQRAQESTHRGNWYMGGG